jgi:hypothetical protein
VITDVYRTDFAALLAPYTLAGRGAEPAGTVLAPDDDDDLPEGVALGEVEIGQAPQGVRTVANRVHPDWTWRLTDGEGVAVRQGKGAPRGSGTRPKLRILEPCRSVALRATGADAGFPDVQHHAVIVWVQLVRTGAWKADCAWAWTTEPAPAGDGRSWARPPRRWSTVGQVAALLYGAASADRMAELHAPRDAEQAAWIDALPDVARAATRKASR